MANHFPLRRNLDKLQLVTDRNVADIPVNPGFKLAGVTGLNILRRNLEVSVAAYCGGRACSPTVHLNSVDFGRDGIVVQDGMAICLEAECPLAPTDGRGGVREPLQKTPAGGSSDAHAGNFDTI